MLFDLSPHTNELNRLTAREDDWGIGASKGAHHAVG